MRCPSLHVDGVVTGAIASDYQWDRINHVCEGLGTEDVLPAVEKGPGHANGRAGRRRDQGDGGQRVGGGPGPLLAGKEIDLGRSKELEAISWRYGMNLAGEGGEYETLVLDSPLHRRRMRIAEQEMTTTRDSGSLRVTKAVLEVKG